MTSRRQAAPRPRPDHRAAQRSGPQCEADADPWRVGRGLRSLAERLEQGRPQLGWDPVAGIVDRDQHALVLAGDPNPDRRAWPGRTGRVGQQVFDDPFDLGRVHPGDHGLHGQLQRPAWVLPFGADAGDQGGQVGGVQLGRHDSPVEPVQVQQVAEQPVQLAGVGRQPVDQVGAIVLGQPRPGPLQGEGDADNRRQRGPQLVRTSAQEDVLCLIECPQLPGGLLLALQRLAHRLLGQLLLADIDDEPVPIARLPGPPCTSTA